MKVKSILIGLLMPILTVGCGGTSGNIVNSLGEITKVSLPQAHYSNIRWAPDGERILFIYDNEKTLFNTGIYNLKESKLQQINIPFDSVISVGWITDSIIFFTNAEGNGLIESLYSYDLLEGKPILLKEKIKELSSVDSSSNADEILLGLKEKSEILKLNSEKTQIMSLEDVPELSPSRFSRQSNKVASFGNNFIKVYDRLSKKSATIADISPGWTKEISWSPDGKWLVFSAGPSKEISGIYIVDSEGKNKPVKVFDRGVVAVDWSPKGDQIVFTTVGSPGVNEVYLLKVPNEFR